MADDGRGRDHEKHQRVDRQHNAQGLSLPLVRGVQRTAIVVTAWGHDEDVELTGAARLYHAASCGMMG